MGPLRNDTVEGDFEMQVRTSTVGREAHDTLVIAQRGPLCDPPADELVPDYLHVRLDWRSVVLNP